MPKSMAHRIPSASMTNEPISICAWLTETEPPFIPIYNALGSVQELRIRATGFLPLPTHMVDWGAVILLMAMSLLHNKAIGNMRLPIYVLGSLFNRRLRSTHNNEGSFKRPANQNIAGCNPPLLPASE